MVQTTNYSHLQRGQHVATHMFMLWAKLSDYFAVQMLS